MDWKNLKLVGAGAAIAAATVLAGGSAASAAGAGVTTGGSSNINVAGGPPAAPLCLLATAATLTLNNTGTFNNVVADTTAVFSSTINHYFGPAGTFSDNQCHMPTAVAGTITVTGGASCASSAATYQRVSDAYVIKSTGGACGTLVFSGNQTPCLPLPVDPCGPTGQQEFAGTYAQA